MPGRLLVLSTSRRVAPGLLSWPAWRALREGDVLTGVAEHPQLPYLGEAGVMVEVVPAGSDAERARLLLERAQTGRTVVWLARPGDAGLAHDAGPGHDARAGHEAGPGHDAGSAGAAGLGEDAGLMRALAALVAASPERAPEVEVIHGSYDLPGARLLDLVATMDLLRSPGGCPWDREQTHASLAPHLLEEAYEVVETIETVDLEALCDELGDVLLQVVFHSRVAAEGDGAGRFTVDDVAGAIVSKLVRRHPHVFGEVEVAGADEVKTNWDAIKAAERAGENGDASVVDGVPLAQPALSLAQALQKRAARAGLLEDAGTASFGEGVGGELFALVARARTHGEDAEALLRHVARAYRERLVELESGGG